MHRNGCLIGALAVAASLFVFPALAQAAPGASWSCYASAARLTLGTPPPPPIPSPIEPVIANRFNSPCADDGTGLNDVVVPPSPETPLLDLSAAFAKTEVLCATDDPDPDVSPENNENCDSGQTYQQQVTSRAGVADVKVNVGGLAVHAVVLESRARAYCDANNKPAFDSFSKVVSLTINGQAIDVPPENVPGTIDLGIAKIVFNERIGSEGEQASDTSGSLTRRALHLTIPSDGSVADLVVGESQVDYTGDVCPEGKIVIQKQTVPDEDPNVTDFGFSSTGGLSPASFTLRDDGERQFAQVAPNKPYTVSENAPPSPYTLGLIHCVDREGDTTTSLPERRANINVGPGETVTCTFINVKPGTPPPGICPPGTVPTPDGKCVIVRTECPPGSAKTPQGTCIITNVRCPEGTTFLPGVLACIEAPTGGRVVPLGEVRTAGPCHDPRFGTSFAIVGTDGPDRITGTNLSDRIFSFGGNDRVSGGRGNDCVQGGSGADVLDGSNGNDYLLGESGNDQVSGGPGADRIFGGSGKDRVRGDAGNDVIRGGAGNDKLRGGDGNDALYGGPGNDGLHTGNGRDRVFAGPGNDIVNAGTRGPAAFVDCGPGRDRVRINNNERHRIRNCELVDVFHRIRGG